MRESCSRSALGPNLITIRARLGQFCPGCGDERVLDHVLGKGGSGKEGGDTGLGRKREKQNTFLFSLKVLFFPFLECWSTSWKGLMISSTGVKKK